MVIYSNLAMPKAANRLPNRGDFQSLYVSIGKFESHYAAHSAVHGNTTIPLGEVTGPRTRSQPRGEEAEGGAPRLSRRTFHSAGIGGRKSRSVSSQHRDRDHD